MRRLLRTAAALLALAVFCYSGYKLFDKFRQEKASDRNTQVLAAAVTISAPPMQQTKTELEKKKQKQQPKSSTSQQISIETDPQPAAVEAVSSDEPAEQDSPESVKEPDQSALSPISVDFDALHQQCGDIVAWLYCPDTPISYPIVQSGDNVYYERRLTDGTWNGGGTPFMDYRCASDFSDFVSIVYGHHIRLSERMFTTLTYYQEQWYYDSHPVMYLSVPEQNFRVDLLFGVKTYSTSAYYSFPQDAESRQAYLDALAADTVFRSSAEYSAEDRLLVLSTCLFTTDDARLLVVGKLVPID